jgi:hypothetical protein
MGIVSGRAEAAMSAPLNAQENRGLSMKLRMDGLLLTTDIAEWIALVPLLPVAEPDMVAQVPVESRVFELPIKTPGHLKGTAIPNEMQSGMVNGRGCNPHARRG